LANAQHLAVEDEHAKMADWIDFDKDSIDTLELEKFGMDIQPEAKFQDPLYENRGFMGSFGLLLWEQLPRWPWYLLMLLGCIGAGGKFFPSFAISENFPDSSIFIC
jgi:ATP-binding cassette subfamily B (MDR/TAP) protein 1